MVGIREVEKYGTKTYADLVKYCEDCAKELEVDVEIFQSNWEGAIIDKIQEAYQKVDGIIINAGAYTHYSIAIMDALKAVGIPVIEVHLSDVYKREEFRHVSYIKMVATQTIVGMGFEGYRQALIAIKKLYI